MNYKQLTNEMKVKIDTLLELGYSMRAAGRELNISHSTISRYKNNVYKKREINIYDKYKDLIDYLHKNYDWRTNSVDLCVHRFKKYHSRKPCVSVQQVYNWINEGKLDIKRSDTCYKKSKRKRKYNGMMRHLEWKLENGTVFPISLRPKRINERNEIGHLEIDSVIGKRNEQHSIITIVDRCSRRVWTIRGYYRNKYYINNLINKYIDENKIVVKSITTDNGKEFDALGICAKKQGVKLYKCDPYCSFQRGSNERMNAIIRRFIPKGKSLKNIPQQYLEDISFKINNMPRKMFDYQTPYQIESRQLQSGAVEI